MIKKEPKVAFGMIVFEGDYVLKESLEQVYPYASQILIAEGPVKFWQNQGKKTSEDNTNTILKNFPDPENKISIIHGQFEEKDQQCSAYMKFLNDNIDYLWNLDSDEVYKEDDIKKIISIMENNKYTSADIKSCSFYGGFDRYIGGFEEKKGNFHRIFKIYPGSKWLTHRPPTVVHDKKVKSLPEKHLDGDTLWYKYGIRMYHYSYVFPSQVKNKIKYYESKVSKENCFKNYFNTIYLPWVQSKSLEDKFEVEKINNGVHEFIKEIREHTFTKAFVGSHPKSIQKRIRQLNDRIKKELSEYDTINLECWNSNKIYESMLAGAKGKIFPKLEDSSHWPVLKNYLDIVSQKGSKNLCDLGCGAASLGLLYDKLDYTGADLPNIIDNVSKINAKNLNFIKFNIYDNVNFLKEFDCIVLNAFIDVMKNPVEILDKILSCSVKHIIIHRQHIGNQTKSWLTNSYNNMTSYQSQISINDLNNLIDKYKYIPIKQNKIDSQFSILLEKT